jgi:murein DD-endopeptidase MepM/ murein hydrolase activator NlpD
VVGLTNIFSVYGLPVFSLPFCITVMLFLYCLPLRSHPGKLTLTPIQSYQPETNLYRYLNDKEQVAAAHTFPLMLPVMGEWMISQGHNGSMTHRGDWRHALDFVLLDEEHKTFQWPGAKPEDFYAYGKPVLSPGDGVVVEAIDYVLDNAIGENNTRQNWGNTIIIQHTTDLFSKLSHLKPGSLMVAKGQYVRKGDIIAQCGNSGRSPEPHLHLQLQATPYIGSKTMNYPITAFLERKNHQTELMIHAVPTEGSFVKNIQINAELVSAFSWQRGTQWQVYSSDGRTETWEAGISIYNESYLHCNETGAYAYYTLSDSQLRFSNFYGDQSSLLYFLYLSAHHVLFSLDLPDKIRHNMPLHLMPKKLNRWFLDALAPFWIPGKMVYEGNVIQHTDPASSEVFMKWLSEISYQSNPPLYKGELNIQNGALTSFVFQKKDVQSITITLQCVS